MTHKGNSHPPANGQGTQHPSDDDVLHFLRVGNECVRAENWSDAEDCFRRVVELRPRHPEAKSMLAMSLFRLGSLTEAKRLYYQLIEQYPENPSLLANLVTILMRQGSLEEAEDILQSFLQISPKDKNPQSVSNHLSSQRRPRASARALPAGGCEHFGGRCPRKTSDSR